MSHNNTGNFINTGNYNTGYRNTGYRNIGNYNTGNCNTGNFNTGDYNIGTCNTGDYNSCDNETGFFNSEKSDTIRVFNKPCLLDQWKSADKPSFIKFPLTKWIIEDYMSDEEKMENQNYKTTGGYLKTYTYKEAFQEAWNNASDEDKELLYNLPNFDPKVFEEISGIKVNNVISSLDDEITINGVVYVRKLK